MEGLKFLAASGAVADVTQESITDVRKLPLCDRLFLHEGPTIEMSLEGAQAFVIPKRAVMAFSTTLQQILAARPAINKIKLHPDQVSVQAFGKIMDFINGNTRSGKPFNLKPVEEVIENIKLYRFGQLLGWSKDGYLYPVFKSIRNYIFDPRRVLGYDELEEIMALGVNEPLYLAAAARFGNLRFHEQIYDEEEFAEWLKEHPDFARAMDKHAEEAKEKRSKRQAEQCVAIYNEKFPALPNTTYTEEHEFLAARFEDPAVRMRYFYGRRGWFRGGKTNKFHK